MKIDIVKFIYKVETNPTTFCLDSHKYFQNYTLFSDIFFNSASMLISMGSAIANEQKSEMVWESNTPFNPNINGAIKIAGMKNKPCLAIARIDALTTFPILCNIMLLIMTNPINVRDKHCLILSPTNHSAS